LNGNKGRCEAVKIKVVKGSRRRLRGVNIVILMVNRNVSVEVSVYINIILSVRGVRNEVDRVSMLWYLMMLMHVRSSRIKRGKGRRLARLLLLLGVARCLVYRARGRPELRALAGKLLPKRKVRL